MGNSKSQNSGETLHTAIEDVRKELTKQRAESKEQQNLLKYKVEVLVNMLAMEEKKKDRLRELIEENKWKLMKQGITEDKLKDMANMVALGRDKMSGTVTSNSLQTTASFSSTPVFSPTQAPANANLAGAVQRLRKEFEQSKLEIFKVFANEDYRLEVMMPTPIFCKTLYSVTNQVSKNDAQILALRFNDGNGNVILPEFFDFMISSKAKRALRSSLVVRKLTVDLIEQSDSTDLINEDSAVKSKTMIALNKVVRIWWCVEEEFNLIFNINLQNGNSKSMKSSKFTFHLRQTCGKKSVLIPTKNEYIQHIKENDHTIASTGEKSDAMNESTVSNDTSKDVMIEAAINKLETLAISEKEADLICARFEFADYVDTGHFMHYMQTSFAPYRNNLMKMVTNEKFGIFYRDKKKVEIDKNASSDEKISKETNDSSIEDSSADAKKDVTQNNDKKVEENEISELDAAHTIEESKNVESKLIESKVENQEEDNKKAEPVKEGTDNIEKQNISQDPVNDKIEENIKNTESEETDKVINENGNTESEETDKVINENGSDKNAESKEQENKNKDHKKTESVKEDTEKGEKKDTSQDSVNNSKNEKYFFGLLSRKKKDNLDNSEKNKTKQQVGKNDKEQNIEIPKKLDD